MIKKEIFDFYFPIIKKYKSLFILMGFSGLITGLSSVIMPLLLKMETDQLVEKNPLNLFGNNISPFEVFFLILLVIFAVSIIERILSSVTNVFLKSKEELLQNETQFELFKKMENMEVGHTMSSRYDYISGIVDVSFQELTRRITNLPKNVIQFIIELFGITIIYAYFDIKLFFIVLISAIIGYIIESISMKVRKKLEVEWKFTMGRQTYKYSRLLLNRFSGLATASGISSTLLSYSKILNEENKNSIKRDFSDLTYEVQFLFNTDLRNLILKLIVGYGVFVGTNSIGMVTLVISSMGTLGDLIFSIFNLKNEYNNYRLDEESFLLMSKICKPVGKTLFDEKINHIEFRNLKFNYPNLAKYEEEYVEIIKDTIMGGNGKYKWLTNDFKKLLEDIKENSKLSFPTIFDDINLKLEKGKVYGIVGKNGAGKTTLMYLLSGFYRNYEGEILFNSKITKDFTLLSFLDRISFLTQQPFLLGWNSTIREELFLGVNKNISEEKAWQYLELFGLAKKIKKNKKMLDSEIGNDIEFSGGEEQILAFIRLLLQDRYIIIMDEGTNQLDAENEVLVMNELLKHKEDKIIIFITHRMSTVSKSDLIYTLENGKISHSGTHKELLQEGNNAYAKFYKHQVLHE